MIANISDSPLPLISAPDYILSLIRTGAQRLPGESPGVVPLDPVNPEYDRNLSAGRKWLAAYSPPICGSGKCNEHLFGAAKYLARYLRLPQAVAVDLIEKGYLPKSGHAWRTEEHVRAVENAAKNARGLAEKAPEGFLVKPMAAPTERAPRRQPAAAHQYTFEPGIHLEGTDTKKGKLSKEKICNALLGHDDWKGVLQWDEFQRKPLAVNPPMRLDLETVGLTDEDVTRVCLWFELNGFSTGHETTMRCIRQACQVNSFHPVREYLTALPPGCPEILDSLSREWFGNDDPTCSLFVHKALVGAVRRIFEPGALVKNSLVLYGPENTKKSSFVAHLFGRWSRSQMPDLEGKEASQACAGVWGIEMSELSKVLRSQQDVVKDFFSRCVDKYRPPYGIAEIEVPRQCVFIGTTNDDDFLRSNTGNTRFWPIEIKQTIPLDWSPDLVWSAAYAAYLSGEDHWLQDQEETAAEEIRQAYVFEDGLEDPVKRALAGKKSVSFAEVVSTVLPGISDKWQSHKVRGILRKLCGPSKRYRNSRRYEVPETIQKGPKHPLEIMKKSV